jgi:hypothetical protein
MIIMIIVSTRARWAASQPSISVKEVGRYVKQLLAPMPEYLLAGPDMAENGTADFENGLVRD